MGNKFIKIYNWSLWALLPYYIFIVLIMGFTNHNTVDAMVKIAWMYGVPLLVCNIVFVAILVDSVFNKIWKSGCGEFDFFWLSVKIFFSIIPVFFFDDNLAAVLNVIGGWVL